MTFEQFLAKYPVTNRSDNDLSKLFKLPPELANLVEKYGGCTFGGGILRIYSAGTCLRATLSVRKIFPEIQEGDIYVFAAAWGGRQLALCHKSPTGYKGCYMMDPSGVEVFQVPGTPEDLLNIHAAQHTQDLLAESYWHQWRSSPAGRDLLPTECVGDKVPLFLGGKDEISNLEVGDMAVYLEMCGQLWSQVKDLPAGTKISGIDVAK